MELEMFLMLLLVVSVFTSLFTEAIKKFVGGSALPSNNIVAGVVSIVLSILVNSGYLILTDASLDAKIIVYFVALVMLSWLSAMVGYDKVVQAITQLRTSSKEDMKHGEDWEC